ncbi:hypothetical protein SDC9_107973 [bioreactor metagenome]|uniref:Protein TolB n=1 Tax=bioreactor metagenome TaxID=1076179 RepID=A0A645B6N4_9ZZZZ
MISFPAYGAATKSENVETYTAYVVHASDRDYQRVDQLVVSKRDHKVLSRAPTRFGCDRVYQANEQLWCFTRITPGKPRYYTDPTGYLFDLKTDSIPKASFKVKGIVSRARIAKDGRFAAGTAFTTGHSYMGVGGTHFSTATFIATLNEPRDAQNIQHWAVSHKGKAITSADLNLWGVTFDPANSDHFMVTVYFDGKPYLGEGNVSSKSIRVLKEGVECPSFSPDGKRIAYKSRTGPTRWSPAVMDLASGQSTVYSHINDSIDDQIEWIDNKNLVFQITKTPLIGSAQINLYTLNLNTRQSDPQLWLEDAKSPTF